MNHIENLKKLLDPDLDFSSINWSHPKNIEWLQNARKEVQKMLSIIEALSDYGPGIDVWED